MCGGGAGGGGGGGERRMYEAQLAWERRQGIVRNAQGQRIAQPLASQRPRPRPTTSTAAEQERWRNESEGQFRSVDIDTGRVIRQGARGVEDIRNTPMIPEPGRRSLLDGRRKDGDEDWKPKEEKAPAVEEVPVVERKKKDDKLTAATIRSEPPMVRGSPRYGNVGVPTRSLFKPY